MNFVPSEPQTPLQNSWSQSYLHAPKGSPVSRCEHLVCTMNHAIYLAFEFIIYIYLHIITKLPDLQSQECTTYYVPEEIATQGHICLPMIATQPIAISKSSLKLWQCY